VVCVEAACFKQVYYDDDLTYEIATNGGSFNDWAVMMVLSHESVL
jgi:hypothetical protein